MPISPEEERRTVALKLAVQLSSQQQVRSWSAANTIEAARKFEAYLNGEQK